jgi:hypothetical protein
MIARFDGGYALADGLNDARRLVAENRRRARGQRSVKNVEIAVADAAGDGPDQNFGRIGLINLDFLHGERLVGRAHDCGFDFH